MENYDITSINKQIYVIICPHSVLVYFWVILHSQILLAKKIVNQSYEIKILCNCLMKIMEVNLFFFQEYFFFIFLYIVKIGLVTNFVVFLRNSNCYFFGN